MNLPLRELILPISQLTISVALIGAILLQQRGTGLGSAFGGEGNVFATRRGIERGLFVATVVLSILFIGIALVNVFIQ